MDGRDWDPNEWEAHCLELLTATYGVRVQKIPARDRGDGGLEAYVADAQTAFQCYAPVDPHTTTEMTNSQKDKIRDDTNKLLAKPEQTMRLIGAGNSIKEWVLLTPSFESKALVEYANGRSVTVFKRAELMGWCGSSFRISVHDDSLFAAARAMLSTAGGRLAVSTPAIDLAEHDTDATGYNRTLIDKLSADPRLRSNPKSLSDYKDATLRDYFRGANELERLSRDVPSVHRDVNICAEIVLNGLARSLVETDDRPVVVVRQITLDLEQKLTSRVPGLRQDLVTLLAQHFVASWWILCPLQFESAEVA